MSVTVTIVGHQGATRRTDLTASLTPARQEHARTTANRWIKQLRLVRYGSLSMRERFTYRGDSLWWFTEIYLHKMRRLEQAIETLAGLETLVDTHAPARLIVDTSSPAAAHAARAFGHTRRLPIEIVEPARPPSSRDNGLMIGVSALMSRLRLSASPRPSKTQVAAFIHTAFWKTGDAGSDAGRETYIGAVLDAIGARVPSDALRLIGVGPRRNFRARRWWDPLTGSTGPQVTPIERLAPRAALAESLTLWRRRTALADEIVAGADIRDAGIVDGYDLWTVLRDELRDAARVQWPWSARAMDEARAALIATEPDVALTYAEAGGWGRALVLEARRLAIPTVGLQHGFIYRHWLNYQHEADEIAAAGAGGGFPVPTRTLVFDRYAAGWLQTAGHFPAEAVRQTGSPKLDELAERVRSLRAERASILKSLGVTDADKLVVLAAKGSEIGGELPRVFDAVRVTPGITLVVKPHPAETRDVYQAHLRPGDPIVIDDPHADLGRLLAAADALVTRNSTVAIDGLVLGIPALVVGQPSNLSPFVDAGVMLGADDGPVEQALGTLLYDRAARDALLRRGEAFAEAYEMRADGHSAARAAEEVLSLGRMGA